MSQLSPLHAATVSAGAVYVGAAGWSMPSHYGDPDAEYRATIAGAALFDYSHAAKLELTGADAAMFLGNLSTNDIKSLQTGVGCESYLCDSRAKVQFQCWVYRAGGEQRQAMWIETTPGRNGDLAKYLDRYLISERVEISDRTTDYAQVHLAGPNAGAILERATGAPVPGLAEFSHAERAFGSNGTGSIRCRDPLGLPGYDILCPNDHAAELWQMLAAAGAVPAGLQTYEVLRIEAGSPLFGPDIDQNRFVMEVGKATRAVSYTKGCYLGQEPIVMARDRAGHVNRAFLGLKVLEGGVPPVGSKVYRDGQEVGLITSSTVSPRISAPIALAYLRWKHQDPGTRMEAETPSGRQLVEVMGPTPVK